MSITNISKGNKALEFIEDRMLDDKYRGVHSSQHERYTMEDIFCILTILNRYIPDGKLMAIRTTDISKRPENTSDEFEYARYCDEVVKEVKKGTQDAMRKLFFVDMHRMGLIKRYNKNKIECDDPFQRCLTKYVSITDFGLRFIKEETLLDRYFIFSKALDNLFRGRIDKILNLLISDEYKIKGIYFDEYMFFVSAIESDTNFSLSMEMANDLISEYRKLSSTQRRAVVDKFKKELKPENFSGNKTNKRDFHNWKNQADQVFHLLNQTVYFEVRGSDEDYLSKKIVPKSPNNKTFTKISKRLERSITEKYNYIKEHDIEKKLGFEFHHVVPLAWSENIHHFKLLDNWKNLVYIDAFSHAKITQGGNRSIILKLNDEDIILSDYDQNEIYLKKSKNILYKISSGKTMREYNSELLSGISYPR